MTVRDILRKCSGEMNVYIYDDEYTYYERIPLNEIKKEVKESSNGLFDKRMIKDWHISNGDLMVEVEVI